MAEISKILNKIQSRSKDLKPRAGVEILKNRSGAGAEKEVSLEADLEVGLCLQS